MKIYIARAGQQTGPFSQLQIQSMLNSGMVTLTDSAWHQGLPEWLPLHRVLDVCPPLPVQPPSIPDPIRTDDTAVSTITDMPYAASKQKIAHEMLSSDEGAGVRRPEARKKPRAPAQFLRLSIWIVALLLFCVAYSVRSVALGEYVRPASLFIVLAIGLFLAFLTYWILRKFRSEYSMLILVIIPSSVGLIGSWIGAHRMAEGNYSTELWYQATQELQKTNGREPAEQELDQIWNFITISRSTPEIRHLFHKIAAQHAIPVFAMILLVMYGFVRKRNRAHL